MAKKRQKKTIVAGVSRDMAEEAFTQYAYAASEEQRILAEIELATVRLRERYSLELLTLKKDKEDAWDVLEAFARENREDLFSKKKSLEMAQGVIGFRTGTPKLKTLKGFTWASVLEQVKKYLPGYVRTTEEVAKDRLLADRELEEVALPVADATGTVAATMLEAMKACGIEVVQDETFFVEPKNEDMEPNK